MRRFPRWRIRNWLEIPLFVVALCGSASAQTLIGSEIPITTAAEFQSGPAIAANPAAGEFLVVWHDARPFGPSGFDIFGQRVSSTGSRIGENVPITTAGGFTPDVAFNSTANEFLVVHSRGGIFGQRVAADGTLISTEITIFAGISQTNPVIAYNSIANQHLVVWGQTAGGVQGRIIDAAGVGVTDPFPLSGTLVGAGNPAVAFNAATNQYLVVWDALAEPFFPSIVDVFGRLVNADGTLPGSFFAFTTADQLQAFPSVAVNSATNQYLVVWSDNRTVETTSGDIFGQRVNADGALTGGNFAISTLPFNEGTPSLAYEPTTDHYLTVWVGQPSGGPPVVDVFGHLLAGDGIPQGALFQVSSAGTAEFSTALGVDPTTNLFLSAWPDQRNLATTNTDVFGQLVGLAPPTILVDIDIKPGSFPNSLHLGSAGAVPVAIFSSTTFDATTVDPATVTLANGPVRLKSHGTLMASSEDVNGDGLLDLVVHVSTEGLQLTEGDAEAILNGRTFDGTPIQGSDSIQIVP